MRFGDYLLLISALVYLGLGVWVAAMDSRRQLHRAFAVMMVNNAVALAATQWATSEFNVAMHGLVYSLALLPFTTFFFAIRFLQSHRPTGWHRSKLVPWTILAGALAVLLFLVVRGDLLRDDSTGVLAALYLLPGAVQAGVALLVIRIATRLDDPGQREALQLLSLGLIVFPAMFGVFKVLVDLTPGGSQRVDFVLGGITTVLSILVGLQSLALARDAAERLRSRFLVSVIAAAFVTGAVTGLIIWESAGPLMFYAVTSFWRLAFAGLVTYAILRFHLFSMDPRFQAVIRDSGFAALATVAFFVVEQFLEQKLQGILLGPAWLESLLPYTAALMATLALLPLRKRIGRFAGRLVLKQSPENEPVLQVRRRQIFEAAWHAAHEDGRVTAREKQALVRLAQELGLPASLANDVPAMTRVARSRTRARGSR